VHATTNTILPSLHNISTTSLLSNCNKDKMLQNSVMSNRSKFGSHKKLNFKINSKTPSNRKVELDSSSKKFSSENMSDEDKLKRFHLQWEENKFQILKKNNNEVNIMPITNKS